MLEAFGYLVAASNGWLLYIIAFIASVAGIYLKGRSDGKTVEKARTDEMEAKAKTISDEVDREVASRSPSTNRERLAKWQR